MPRVVDNNTLNAIRVTVVSTLSRALVTDCARVRGRYFYWSPKNEAIRASERRGARRDLEAVQILRVKTS